MKVTAGTQILDEEGFGLIFLKTAADTNGALLEMEAAYRPSSVKPPLHFHPAQEETFEVLQGSFAVTAGEQQYTFHAGDRFTIPYGTPHAMHNISNGRGRLLWQTRPALNSEGFFSAMWGMEAQPAGENRGVRRILRLAVIFQEYHQEVRLSSPLQRTLLGLLAPLGRLAGIRPHQTVTAIPSSASE
jgi:mannose-6-phosphate isomerase-like protein (cupin superfamily)